MISLITFVELRSMEGNKRARSSNSNTSVGGGSAINFVDEEQQRVARSSSSGGNNALVGIRSEILKEEGGGGVPGDYCYPDVPEVDGIHQQQQEQQHQQHQQQQQQEHDSSKGFSDYGHLFGPVSAMSSEYRRMGQWNSHSESLSSDYPERYKRLVSAGGHGDDLDQAGTGPDERRVRSRQEASVLSNLLGRRDDQTELHMNISARTLRPSGGKDRHSKVFTAKGPRDRRVRLSVSTAIQFYDVQDRLGYDQPSKAVEWLMKKAKNAIDELSQIPLPGIDRLTFPSSSYNTNSHCFGYSSTTSGSGALSGSSTGHEQFTSERLIHGGLVGEELENRVPEAKAVCSNSRVQQQAVEESDGFARQRREEDLGADITISVGECGSSRTGRGGAAAHHHAGSLGGFGAAGQISTNAVLQPAGSCHGQLQQQQQHRDWKNLLHPNPGSSNSSSGSTFFLYDDPNLADQQQHHHHHQQQHQQQQQQHHHQQQQRLELFQTPAAVQYLQNQHRHQQTTSLITVQQTYLQQQDFLHNSSSPVAQSIAKPALDQFHSLKIASPAAAAAAAAALVAATEKPDTTTVSSTALRFPSSFLGSPFQQQQQQQQQQQVPSPSIQLDSSQEFPAKFHGLEEQLRRGSKRRE